MEDWQAEAPVPLSLVMEDWQAEAPAPLLLVMEDWQAEAPAPLWDRPPGLSSSLMRARSSLVISAGQQVTGQEACPTPERAGRVACRRRAPAPNRISRPFPRPPAPFPGDTAGAPARWPRCWSGPGRR